MCHTAVIYLDQRYLQIEVPVGVQYTNLKMPVKAINKTTLPYCVEFGDPASYIDPAPCLVWDENDAVFPIDQPAIFITTRVTNMTQSSLCAPDTVVCKTPWKQVSNATTYYVADIESYTLRVQHSFQGIFCEIWFILLMLPCIHPPSLPLAVCVHTKIILSILRL
jgi:hypothetical protein